MRSTIESPVLKFFSKFKEIQQYKKGETVLYPDKQPAGCYYLKKGFIREYTVSENGAELTIHIFSPGSFFPTTWIINDTPNRYYFETITPVELSIAPKNDTIQFLRRNPNVLFDLTRRLLQGLDKLSFRIELLVFDKADKKVASILLFLSRHFGKITGNTVYIDHLFSHREIASLAGVSRETASRELENFQKEGIITYKREILIKDLSLLEKKLSKPVS